MRQRSAFETRFTGGTYAEMRPADADGARGGGKDTRTWGEAGNLRRRSRGQSSRRRSHRRRLRRANRVNLHHRIYEGGADLEVTEGSMSFAYSHAMYPGSDSWVILRRANILHRVSSKERFVSQLHGNSLAPNLQYTAQSSAPLFVSPDAASSVLSIPALCRLPGRGGAAPSANPQPVGASPGVDLLLSNLQDKTPSSQNIKRMV